MKNLYYANFFYFFSFAAFTGKARLRTAELPNPV